MRILITGSAGFIGSWLADELAKQHEVLGLDNFSGGFIRNTLNHDFLECDLSEKGEVDWAIRNFKPEVLYHCAASAREIGSLFEPARSFRDNSYAYMNTLSTCIKYGLKKVILFSSMAVYGNQPAPFNEEMPRQPEDIYGLNKAIMEESTILLSQIHGFEWTILRPHNVIGPRQNLRDRYRNVFAIWMNRIMSGEKQIYIFGDGEQRRAFSPIECSLPCYIKCLEPQTNSQIYNIGGMTPITLNEAAMFCKVAVKDENIEIVHVPPRPNEVKLAYCTYDKSVKELGYTEKSDDLFACLVKMANWAKELGPQPWCNDKLELINDKTPEVWR